MEIFTGNFSTAIQQGLKYRWIQERLPKDSARRIVVLTGARQTGKTTLVKMQYPELNYISLDSIEDRQAVSGIKTSLWSKIVGRAIIDEAQKEPTVFEKIKWAYDQGEIDFSVLTGSSQILLLSKVRETLAGRGFLFDLWPLMASELRSVQYAPPEYPLIHRILKVGTDFQHIMEEEPSILMSHEEENALFPLEYLSRWGGMPELLRLNEKERGEWLRSYQQTYLERDLSDLARLKDLGPFLTFQRLAMLRSASLISFSDLARDAGVSVNTARRYLEYLRISYQAFMLKPWYRNLTSRMIKAPKLYWLDIGLLRQGTGQWGPLSGQMFETLAVSEIKKWLSTNDPDTRMFFYRTRSGMEVDLILETPDGLIGIEIKNRERLGKSDFRPLKALADALKGDWKGGIVLYNGREIIQLSKTHSIWGIPLYRFV